MHGPILQLAAERRYTARVDGVECLLDDTIAAAAARVLTIDHAGVPQAVGGRGIAGALVQAAFDAARAKGWKARPACSCADAWLARHPAYSNLRG